MTEDNEVQYAVRTAAGIELYGSKHAYENRDSVFTRGPLRKFTIEQWFDMRGPYMDLQQIIAVRLPPIEKVED